MNTLKLRPRLAAALAGLLVCLVAIVMGARQTVMATPSFGFTSTVTSASGVAELSLKTLSPNHQVRISTKGLSDVYVVSNVVSPGGYSGWHTHPGPSVVVVKSGRATLYDGDDPTWQAPGGKEELARLAPAGAGTRIVAVFRGADAEGEPIVAVGALPLTAQ